MATNNESTPARRIDDHRPAVALEWTESGAQQARAPFDRPDQWTILLTSSNHGLVGAHGHNFPHATGDFVRVNVCDEAVVVGLRERIRKLEAAATAQPSAADVRAAALEEAAQFIEGQERMSAGEIAATTLFGKLIRFLKAKEAGYGCIKDAAAQSVEGASK